MAKPDIIYLTYVVNLILKLHHTHKAKQPKNKNTKQNKTKQKEGIT